MILNLHREVWIHQQHSTTIERGYDAAASVAANHDPAHSHVLSNILIDHARLARFGERHSSLAQAHRPSYRGNVINRERALGISPQQGGLACIMVGATANATR